MLDVQDQGSSKGHNINLRGCEMINWREKKEKQSCCYTNLYSSSGLFSLFAFFCEILDNFT